jgi:hypothetical protein
MSDPYLRIMPTATQTLDYLGDGEHNAVSEQWSRRFLDRHPELHKMKQKPIELAKVLRTIEVGYSTVRGSCVRL